ncbi:MAG TPA: RecX family transcriptional regulator [Polyangiaceae bacterium]|nr:RecX family transcriptional regulator [Polyangiaceae bacterium]
MPGFGKGRPKLERTPRPPNVTRAGIEAAALRYLERFDCSVARLRKVLRERVAKAARAGVAEASAAPAIVEELLLRYQASGLIDDQRFAKNFAARQRDRGMSGRMIEQKLRARGIDAEVVQQLLPRGESASVELEAARAFARRRRLGPHRKPDVREAYRRKDLMALARAGFNYDTASRVVGNSSSTDDEF